MGTSAARVRRRWTAEEDDQLRHLIEQGWSTRRIAGVLQRSIIGVYRRAATRWGGVDVLRHRLFAVRSGREMLALMGVQKHTMRLWIQRRWLRAHRGYGRRSRDTSRLRLLVSDEALDEFLAVRDAWATWSPADITDPDWRHRAEELRAKAGGRWWRTDELAAQLGVSRRTTQVWAQVWAQAGGRPTIKVAERWHVWVQDAERPAAPIALRAMKEPHG